MFQNLTLLTPPAERIRSGVVSLDLADSPASSIPANSDASLLLHGLPDQETG